MPDNIIDLAQLPRSYHHKGANFIDAFLTAVDSKGSRGKIQDAELEGVMIRAARYDDGDGCLTPKEVLMSAKRQVEEDRVQEALWQTVAEQAWPKCAASDDCRDSTYARWQAAEYTDKIKVNEKLIAKLKAQLQVPLDVVTE
jgi:hypothetical protein